MIYGIKIVSNKSSKPLPLLSQNFWDILILLGAIQGFIMSVLLYRIKSNQTANRLLSWIIVLISLACLNIYLPETINGNYATLWAIFTAVFPLVVLMPIGPLIYFYVKALMHPEFKLSRKNRFHFYPILLDLIPYLAAAIFIIGVLIKVINPENNNLWGNFINKCQMYVDIPRWISITIYLWMAYKMIYLLKENQQHTEQFKWAKRFVLGFAIFQGVWLFHLIPYIIPFTSNILLNSLGWYPVYIPLIVLVYWLGINGYLIGHKSFLKIASQTVLNPEVIQNTLYSLETAMQQDRLFLDASLKLNYIVKHTGIPQKTISAVLNQHLGKSFNEYVNEFRVNEFKTRLLDPVYSHLTMTGIAFECGFNSQATFQRTFKSLTNQSPREFRQTALQNRIDSTQI